MSRLREAAAVVAALIVAAVATTYPLAARLSTHIASDLGDPLLVAWMLAWDADRFRHGLVGLWDAPNFFPYRHTLLYSEHFLGVAIFTAPLQWATRNPILVYNAAFLGSFVVTGGGMYVLARWLTGRRDTAAVAAAIFACYPFRASHSSHLQLLVLGWLPLSVWALHRYFTTRRLRDLVAAAVFYLLQALTSGYFAYFSLVPLTMVGAYELWRGRGIVPRLVVHAAIAAALVAAVMLPIVRAYADVRRESGLRRPVDEITRQSADVGDYLSASPSLRIWGGLGSGRGEHELFPGFVAVALAGFAFFRLSAKASGERRAIALYAAILIVAVALSMGPAPTFFGRPLGVPGPYALLLRLVPGFDGLRVPARFAVVAQLALAVLGAFGAGWLIDRLAGRGRVEREGLSRAAVASALVLLVAAEGWAALGTPAFDPQGDPHDRAAYAYLKSLPRGAAIELPSFADRLLPEFTYQYMTLVHGHPIVNGHSGYLTPLVVWLRGGHSPLLETGRQADAVTMLRAIGVRYLVVHHDAYADASLRDELLHAIATAPEVIAHRAFEGTTIAVLAPFETPAKADGPPVPAAAIAASASDAADRLPFLFDGDRDSRWLTGRPQSGDESLTLALDRPRDIALVRLQLGTRSFGDYPRDLAIESIEDGGARTLFRGSILPQFARGVLADGDYPFIDVALPPNRTRTLRLAQRGTARTFYWSVHELQLIERK